MSYCNYQFYDIRNDERDYTPAKNCCKSNRTCLSGINGHEPDNTDYIHYEFENNGNQHTKDPGLDCTLHEFLESNLFEKPENKSCNYKSNKETACRAGK